MRHPRRKIRSVSRGKSFDYCHGARMYQRGDIIKCGLELDSTQLSITVVTRPGATQMLVLSGEFEWEIFTPSVNSIFSTVTTGLHPAEKHWPESESHMCRLYLFYLDSNDLDSLKWKYELWDELTLCSHWSQSRYHLTFLHWHIWKMMGVKFSFSQTIPVGVF